MSKWAKAIDSKSKEIDSLLLNVSSGIYYVKKFKDGKTLFKTTKTDNLTLAKSIRDKLLSDFLSGKPIETRQQEQAQGMVIAQLCEEFVADRKTSVNHAMPEFRISYRTWQKDITETNTIKKHFGNLGLKDITTKWWLNWYKLEAKKLDRGPREIKRYMSLIFKFALAKGYIESEPQFPLPPKSKATKSKGTFTDEEIGKLYAITDPHVRLLVALCIENGLRTFEGKRLRWDHIVFSDKKRESKAYIENESPKKPSRWIRITDTSAKELRAWKAQQVKAGINSPWVFPREDDANQFKGDTFWTDHWNAAMEEVKVPAEKTSYWMRHTFVTKAMFEDKKHTQDISLKAGASEATLNEHYAHGEIAHTVEIDETSNRIAKLGRSGAAKILKRKAAN